MPARKSRNSRQQPMQDGLQNVVAQLGMGRDKAAHSVYVAGNMQQNELLDAYRASWLSKAIIDYPAEDATRKWRKWRADAAQITRIERLEKKLHVAERVQDALVSARLFGGAAIYINVDGQDQDKPLEPVAGKDIKSLVVLPRSSLTPSEIVRDIQSPYYGKPEYYTLTSTGDGKNVTIHASRLVIFIGATVPGDMGYSASFNQGWGDSVLQSTLETIKQVDATMANMASLVFEAKVDVFKFEGFAEMLANTANDALVSRRLSNQAAMKGINGAVVIDTKDDYQQKNATFGGLPDVVTKFMDSVAGASRIPVTRLYGRAAVGLSGSGDGDERVYFDRIGHIQASEISPALEILDELLIWQALGSRPEEIFYEWTPLRQLTENERADIFVKTATAARNLAGANAGELVPLDALSDALVNEITEQGCLPGLEKAVKEYGSLSEQGLPSERQTTIPIGVKDYDPNQPRDANGQWSGGTGSSGNFNGGDAKVKEEIARHIEEDEDYADFGLRVVPSGFEVEVGVVLPPSKIWDDGTDTGEELSGTSTIGVRSNNIDMAISDLKRAGYSGNQIVLVKGESQGSGEDLGEVIISEATVVAFWKR